MFQVLRNCGSRHILGAKHFRPARRNQFNNQSLRHSSHLYPATSERWDDAMVQAEHMVGDLTNFSNLQKWFSGEFTTISRYIQRLVGTNHPMLETAKRCSYIAEGRMGSAQARGLIVILTAKAVQDIARDTSKLSMSELIQNQVSLAEMTELTYSAYMIHRGVMDLKRYGLENVTLEADEDKQLKDIHYGNKVSILCGDFLLAYTMRGFGCLYNNKATDLIASSITDFMNGEFILIDDWKNANYLMSSDSRDISRWEKRVSQTIGSLQGNMCQGALVLAGIDEKLQKEAREFGKNLTMAWQGHTELQPFLRSTYEPIQLPEMPEYPAFDLNSLPVLLFLRESHNTNRNFRLFLNKFRVKEQKAGLEVGLMRQHRHQDTVDYGRLHEMILDLGNPIDQTLEIIRNHSHNAIKNLESFPDSEAKDMLINICDSLHRL